MTYVRTDTDRLRRRPAVQSFLTAIITCAASIWMSAGCSSTLVGVKGQLPTHPEIEYDEVVRAAPVVGVVVAREDQVVYDTLGDKVYPRLVRGSRPDVVSFDSAGGNVLLDEQSVMGKNAQGKDVAHEFSSVLYLQVKEIDIAKKFITPYDLTCDREEATADPDKRIKHGSSPCWDVIEFDGHGGKYDSLTHTIEGTSRRGTPVKISIDECLQIRYRRPHRWKMIHIGLGALGLFLGANGIFHFWDAY